LSALWAAASLHAWNLSAQFGRPMRRGLSVFRGMLPLGILTYIALPPAWDYGTSGLETGLSLTWLGLSFLMMTRLAIGDLAGGPSPGSERRMRGDLPYYAVGFFLGLG